MFGLYRTFLAFTVVALHIGGVPWAGGYAVYGFYMLSGYLMTMIMQRTYGYTSIGVVKFLINRALRIYPLYWVSILFSVLIIFYLGETFVESFHKYMHYPTNFYELIKNVFIIFPDWYTTRLTPPAWALTVELFFYVLIALGLSKRPIIALCWLAISIIYHVLAWFGGWDRYASILAGSLPFALGSVIYFYRTNLLIICFNKVKNLPSYLPLLLATLMGINWYLGVVLTISQGLFFYVNLLLCVLMLLVLSSYKALPFLSKKVDAYWGDFSYPIYLIHYQVALIVFFILEYTGVDISHPSMWFMWISIPFIILVAWILILFVERPIERLRTKIKEKSYKRIQ